MADEQKPKGKLDTADLKARLGLKKKARAAPMAPQPKPKPAPEPVTPAAAGAASETAASGAEAPTHASIQEARRKAEEAAKEAGPALEDFSVIGQENTPVPAALPGTRVEYVSVGADATFPGRAKKQRLMLVLLVVVVAAVGFLLGNLFSGASLQNEVRDSYVREAREKDDLFKSQTVILEAIKDLKTKVRFTAEQVQAVKGDKDKDPLVLEKTFEGLIPVLSAYVKNQIYLDPVSVMGETMYNGALMRDVVEFAVRSRLLYDHVSNALQEMTTYLRMAQPPSATTRVLMVKTDQREVEGLGTIPIATGVWIQDTGKPAAVALKDAQDRDVGTEWQQMVLPVGAKEPVQVSTKNVMQLDLKSVYEERAKHAKRMSLDRLAAITTKLNRVASALNSDALIKSIRTWSTKEL